MLGRIDLTFVPNSDNLVIFHRLGALENSGEGVIITRWYRVELMIVAARTTNCHTHECPPERINLFVNDVHLHFARIIFSEHFGAYAKKPGCHRARMLF